MKSETRRRLFLRATLLIVFMGSGLFVSTGCTLKPTKAFEKSQPKGTGRTSGAKVSSFEGASLEITESTVILDARPQFEYSFAHLNGALSLSWDEFTQREPPFLGLLEKDIFFYARKLSRMGINPATPVIVVGRGRRGQGEEGRLAWTLRYMGIDKVAFASIDYFKLPLSNLDSPPPKATTIWNPYLDESLIIEKSEVQKIISTPRDAQNGPVLLDVRSAEEYLAKEKSKLGREIPDIGAMNIPFEEFVDQVGLPQQDIISRLNQVGINPERELILISEQGVRSGAVTMILRSLGFKKARNFAGGYRQLLLESEGVQKSSRSVKKSKVKKIKKSRGRSAVQPLPKKVVEGR